MSECLCGACGGGANYPAAPGAVATKLRMTNELSAGGSRGGRSSSPGVGREELSGGEVGAKVTASAACLRCVATHSDSQHIVAGGTFGDSPPTPEGNQEKNASFLLLLQTQFVNKVLSCFGIFCHSAAEEKCLNPPYTHCICYIIICSSERSKETAQA